MLNKLITSKKARALMGTVAIILIGTVLSFLGIEMTDAQQLELAKYVGGLIVAAAGIYKVAQGIADGGSGGKTSANYKPVVEAVAVNDDGNVISRFIKDHNLTITKGRKSQK